MDARKQDVTPCSSYTLIVMVACLLEVLTVTACAAQPMPLPLFVERVGALSQLDQAKSRPQWNELLSDLMAEPSADIQEEKLVALAADTAGAKWLCKEGAKVFPTLHNYSARMTVLGLYCNHYVGLNPPACEEGEPQFANLMLKFAVESDDMAEKESALPGVQQQVQIYFASRWQGVHDEIALEGLYRIALTAHQYSPDAPGWSPIVDDVLALPHRSPKLVNSLHSKLRILREKAKDPAEKKELQSAIEKLEKGKERGAYLAF
jgi:hypothetical protein